MLRVVAEFEIVGVGDDKEGCGDGYVICHGSRPP